MKIIQENHLKKDEQAELDWYVTKRLKTYREIYEDKTETENAISLVKIVCAVEGLAGAFADLSMSAKEAVDSFAEMFGTLEEATEVEYV